jgi:hypothetical protein
MLSLGPRHARKEVRVGESRRKRARRLGRASWELLREDRRLVVFPVVSTMTSLVLGAASFAVSDGLFGSDHQWRAVIVVAAIIASFPVTFVTLFTGVALALVLERKLAGEEVSASVGWQGARARTGIIAEWTVLSCTVGAVLRLLEQRLPLAGRVTAWLADASWSLATVFAVPVLAYEQLGPFATLKRSARIFRDRWGEQIGGVIALDLGLVFFTLPGVVLLIVGVSSNTALGVVLAAVGGASIVGVGAFASALNTVYRVFLYRSAVGLETGTAVFDAADLANPGRQGVR